MFNIKKCDHFYLKREISFQVDHAESFGQRLTGTENVGRDHTRNIPNLSKPEHVSQVAERTEVETQQIVDVRKRFEQDQHDKRVIDQLFRNNLVDAFKQAASIKRNEEYQPMEKSRGGHRHM